MTLKGNTGDFPLDTILRLLGDTKKTGELTLRGDAGAGALGLNEGRVVAAVYGDEPPIPALGSIWSLGRVEFEFTPWNDAPPANLEGELQDNLRKADEYRKWMESVRQVIPHDRIRFRLSERAAEQGAVTFTSDRWRVVLAVNGERDVNTLAAHLKVDRDTALNTLAGLVRDGVIETIEPPVEAHAPLTPGPPPAPEVTPPSEPLFVAPSEPAPPAPPAEPSPPPPTMREEPKDWTAALLEKRQQQEPGSPTPQATRPPGTAPEWTPPPPVPDTPRWTAPAPAPGTEQWTPPAPFVPQETSPRYDAAKDAWTAPAPPVETPQWSPPAAESGPEWTPPASQAEAPAPEAIQAEASSPEAPQWTAPTDAAPWTAPAESQWAAPAESAPPAFDSAPPAAESAPTSFESAPPVESAPKLDDRLAALEGLFNPPPTTTEAPPEREWTMPAPAQEWTTPQEAAPAAPTPAVDDPRLSALSAPPPVAEPPRAAAPPAQASEWAPPPPPEPRAPEKKKGLFGGIFGGGKREDVAAARGALSETVGSSQAGMLASFSNALLNEYNSGQYGKGKVDDRIPSLLMRVDEQADPIDKPLPVVDDRLDVQALERVGLPETQAVPYLAMLVSTIYADAEKAFGRDKAKRGYRAAQQQVFRGDTTALTGVAGKLPKI